MRNISTVRTAILDPGGTRTQMRARAYPGEDPQSIKDPAAVGEFVAKLMVDGFDSTAFHALPKVMEKACSHLRLPALRCSHKRVCEGAGRSEEHTSELQSLMR